MPGVVTYPNYRFATDLGAHPRGVQSVYEYNNLVLNDRLTPDFFRINDFSGFDEPDVRDSREVRPQQHGEFVYDSYYGGKTGTIEGRAVAGNTPMLDQMHREFGDAFGALIELPLKSRWYDFFDGFNDPNALSYYTKDVDGAQISVVNGMLVPAATGTTVLYRSAEQRSYGDVRVTMKINPNVASATISDFGFMLARTSAGNYLYGRCQLGGGVASLSSEKVVGAAAPVLLSSPAVATGTGTSWDGATIWVRYTKIGNELVMELWTTDPYFAPFGTLPYFSNTVVLMGAEADAYGEGVMGGLGVRLQNNTTSISYDDVRVESIYPGDAYLMCKKVDKPQWKNTQGQRLNYSRDFQISLRASDHRWKSNVMLTKTLLPSSVGDFGRFYDRSYSLSYPLPMDYRGFPTSTSPLVIATCVNKGGFAASPIIRIYGPITRPMITNATNGQLLFFNSIIISGAYVDIDIAANTVIASDQNSVPQLLAPGLDFMSLDPGPNDLVLTGQDYTTGTTGARALIGWRHSWR